MFHMFFSQYTCDIYIKFPIQSSQYSFWASFPQNNNMLVQRWPRLARVNFQSDQSLHYPRTLYIVYLDTILVHNKDSGLAGIKPFWHSDAIS